MTVSLRAQTYDVDEAIAKWGSQWCDLADRVPESTLFQRPAAIKAWQTNYAKDVRAAVIIVHKGESLRAVLAIMVGNVWRGPTFSPRVDYAAYDRQFAAPGRRFFPVRQVASAVSWQASSIRPQLLCSAEDRADACLKISEVFARMRDMDAVVLPTIVGSDVEHWAKGFKAAGLVPFSHALNRKVFTLENLIDMDALVAAKSSNFRKNYRRTIKRANDAGVVVKTLVGREEVMTRLDDLADVANRSWKNTGSREGVATLNHDATQQQYLLDMLSAQEPGLVPILSLAEHGETTIAAALWLSHGRTLTGLYVFRDENALPINLGLLIIDSGYRNRERFGATRVDLNSTQDWVRPLADTCNSLCNVICFSKTGRGRLYQKIAMLRRRLKPI